MAPAEEQDSSINAIIDSSTPQTTTNVVTTDKNSKIYIKKFEFGHDF